MTHTPAEPHQDEPTTTEAVFSKDLELVAYVLDELGLHRIDEYARASLRSGTRDDIAVSCAASTHDDGELLFTSTQQLVEHLSRSRVRLKTVRIDYRRERYGRLEVFFDPDGRISFKALGPNRDFHFVSEGLQRELQALSAEPPWSIRKFVMSRALQNHLFSMVLPLSLAMMGAVFAYVYAERVGVNVDPNLLYSTNDYYNEVEQALRSDSVELKLNVLLKGHLKGFTNVSDFLMWVRAAVFTLATSLLVAVLGGLFLRQFSTLYERTYFALGSAKIELEKIERKRDWWVRGVAAAFLLNVIAGLVVAALI